MATESDKAGADAASKSSMSDLGPRIASGIVMIAAALGSLWAGGHVFNLFWLAASLAILWEWQKLIGGANERRRFFVGVAALLTVATFTVNRAPEMAIVALLIGTAAVAYVADTGKRLWSGAGVVYAGALLISVILLRASIIRGFEGVAWLFAVVWTTDIMAYFGGRLIGGPKLWPRVSPKKTWSGFLVGTISAAICGWAVLRGLLGPAEVATLPILALGWITAVLSQGGDFLESGLKRRFSVKDASHLIPGHGGVMDRLDGFLVAAIFVALLGTWRAGSVSAALGLLNW
jgi:phosphatidate cytidylyltransferase